MIKDGHLRRFWDELTTESRQMIVEEYNKNLNINREIQNKVQCSEVDGKPKLIIEKNSGLHYFNGEKISSLLESQMLKPQALIDGRASIKKGNIAPYCVHFVRTPFSFLLDDFKKQWEEMGNHYKPISNAESFGWCCDRFLHMQEFMPNPYVYFYNTIPLIFVYKRKGKDIDIMNDQELDIHKEFYKYSYLVDRDDYGFSEFEDFMDKTMAILGGINIKALDGIIISRDSFENLGVKPFPTFDVLVEYLITVFPQLYISDECGNILYMPEKNKIVFQKKIKNPFIH